MNAPVITPAFPPVVFSVTDAGIAELEAKHKGMVVAHGDKNGYLALQAIAEVRTARTDVENEAARPDREKIIAHVRKCIDEMPDVSTEIGKHYAADVREGLEALLLSWNVEVKEAA